MYTFSLSLSPYIVICNDVYVYIYIYIPPFIGLIKCRRGAVGIQQNGSKFLDFYLKALLLIDDFDYVGDIYRGML